MDKNLREKLRNIIGSLGRKDVFLASDGLPSRESKYKKYKEKDDKKEGHECKEEEEKEGKNEEKEGKHEGCEESECDEYDEYREDGYKQENKRAKEDKLDCKAAYKGILDVTIAPSHTEKLEYIERLEDFVTGDAKKGPEGTYFHIENRLSLVLPSRADLTELYKKVILGPQQFQMFHPEDELMKLLEVQSDRITFLDIETAGFAGSVVFLIGWCYFSEADGDLRFTQLLARDYSEEAAILKVAAKRLEETELLVSYNGKRFDYPMLSERAIYNRVSLPQPTYHIDLLDYARRLWREELPDCKLKTIERLVCGRQRPVDVPSDMIGGIYHDYVKTGSARKISVVVYHNLLDLFALVDVAISLIYGGRVVD